jgi:hypothetical protein
VRARKGNPAEARADLTAVVNLFADIEDLGMVMQQLVQFAFLSLTEGDTERAFRLLGAALAAQAKSQILLLRIEHLAQGAFEEAAARIGKQRAEELMAEGRLMPARQAMAYALEAPAGAALRS